MATTFIISLLIHITGISLFSLIMPVSKREIMPVEVSLLPVGLSPEKSLSEVRSISPEIPKSSPRKEKITIETRKEILRFSPYEVAGVTPILTPPEILSARFELPEVKIPEITPFNVAGSSSPEKISALTDVEIEGPAGGRKLIYREPVEYPVWARAKAMEGNIRIKFWVAPDGKIVLTNLITSSGYPELDFYTEQRFRRWVFESVRTDKQVWGLITFRFYLK
ncbi:MAG: TonB family protein [Candidatus Omnitrophica bacterium]|nr:TonB family protein [Candidatus Omnitrophota bacterium]